MGGKNESFFDDFMRYKQTTGGSGSSGAGSNRGGGSGDPCGTFFVYMGLTAVILFIGQLAGCM